MTTGHKIGVVVQSPDDAAVGLKRCIALARRTGSSLHVIDLTEPPPRWLVETRHQRHDQAERLRDRRALMERFVSNVRADGVEVSVTARRGQRVVELVDEIRTVGLDLVVIVGARLRSSPVTAEAFLNRVVRKSPVPVLVLRPLEPGRSGTVIALDISVEDDGSRALVESIAAQALRMTPDGHAVTIVHVLELPDGFAPREPESVRLIESAVSRYRTKLESLADELDPSGRIEVVVRVGGAAAEIAGISRDLRAELVAIGTVGRSGPAGLLIGNTAEATLRGVACSVLTVKPTGFRSPLG